MVITTSNYYDSVRKVDWNAVPASLKKVHDTLIPDASKNNWDIYNTDADIHRVVEKYFGYIGEHIALPESAKTITSPQQNKILDNAGEKTPPLSVSKMRKFGKRQPVAQKASKNKRNANDNEELPKAKQVVVIPTSSSFIKRYAALDGKVKTRDQVLALVHGLQKAITEQRIRKDDPAIAEIKKMQSELISLANTMGDSVRIEIDNASLTHYKQIAQGEEVRTTVKLLKSFISMNGKAVDRTRTSALLTKMEKALQAVPKEDPYLSELKSAMKALKDYAQHERVPIPAAALHGLGAAALRHDAGLGSIRSKNEPLVVCLLRNEGVKNLSDNALKKAFKRTVAPGYFFELAKAHIRSGQLSIEILNRPMVKGGYNGLKGIDVRHTSVNNLDILDAKLRNVPLEKDRDLGSVTTFEQQASTLDVPPARIQSVSAKDLAGMHFETVGYRGRFAKVIGDPSPGFHMMVYGPPENGKSSFVIELCKDLALLKRGRIAYLALEEGISYSMQKKVVDLGAGNVEGLEFKNGMPPSLEGFDTVVIDSVSDRGISREKLRQLFLQNPKVSFICIFHATKSGSARGGLDFAHDMDIILNIRNHEPIVEKNRFL